MRVNSVRKKTLMNGEENPYYEGNLNEGNKAKLKIYDKAIDDVNTYFANIDFQGNLYVDTDLVGKNDYNIVDVLKSNNETKAVVATKVQLLNWLENQRNEYVTTMIEEQDD